jgi:hypothetical protein
LSYPTPCKHCGEAIGNAGVYLRHRSLREPVTCYPVKDFARLGLEKRLDGAWHFKSIKATHE